ncbi:MAG: MOSC domain-containing protein [Bdellovibrionaceae bacterium]|nr:MOSC domain-containing protein [Pseudobdellovibrionaceae bacterium]
MKVLSLHRYPVKSLRGIDLPEAPVDERGLVGDREFVITDLEGRFLTQRQLPVMALVRASFHHEHLHLRFEGQEISAHVPDQGDEKTIQVWKDQVRARRVSPQADHFLTQALGTPVQLFRVSQPRPGRDKKTGEAFEIRFPDQAPVLLTTTKSLEALNAAIEHPLPMSRFRPNIVIDGLEAWVEESWGKITIGDVEFAVLKPCSRCKIITIDQLTGQVGSPEALQALKNDVKGHRPTADFGVHLRVLRPGVLRVGDAVQQRPV